MINAPTENSIITETYIGYEALVSYLNESKNNWTYKGFLNLNQDVISASLPSLTNSSLTSIKWQSFDITWYKRFLECSQRLLEPNTFVELKKKMNTEHLCYPNRLQAYWKEVIKECEKENLATNITTITSLPKQTQNTNIKDFSKKNINFCYDILDELTSTSYAYSFFKFIF
ncbi:hypothetical protein GLOIN_2v1824437 [Rhizophagus clarus]|uniref:Uncharacterized protein n=1 Tax=Rhizophagus clarus TaxID=94130 RepID=A0A8H3LKH1_9GLOM|nr:hypothetical protein GLOIN_2v1824437 [Rhizophagus clarus]